MVNTLLLCFTNKTLNAIPLNVSVVSVSSLTPTARKLNDNVIASYYLNFPSIPLCSSGRDGCSATSYFCNV